MASQGTGAAGGGSEGKGEGEGGSEGEGAAKKGKPFKICSVADTCDYCGQYSTTKRCSLCHDARYCDMICLQKHRSDHRGQCLLIQEERAKKEAKERARAKVLEGLGVELYQASFLGKAARVSQLLKLGIDVNFVMTEEGDAKGGFPLIAAAQEGQVDVVRLLLAADGVLLNQACIDNGNFPLYMACQQSHIEVVRLLLAVEGVSVNQARTQDGGFPLYMACQRNHIEVVRLLLAAHAQVNQVEDEGWSACHTAARYGHVQVLEMLLEAGADVELKSDSGVTALDLAINFKHPAAEAVIRKHLAKLKAKAEAEAKAAAQAKESALAAARRELERLRKQQEVLELL